MLLLRLRVNEVDRVLEYSCIFRSKSVGEREQTRSETVSTSQVIRQVDPLEMFSEADERAPLLQFPGSYSETREPENLPDAYKQFCALIGNRPLDLPPEQSYYPPKDSLYHRAVQHRKNQGRMYHFTSALTNTLILSQVVLGAALTGLGASDSSRVLITVFGALNTVIAGLVAFLKSRGQPMRARMFRDDLDRVVDEIENSATMWKGISQRVHGYDAIDTDESVTVRSEVARLTRLYDRAVKTNTMNGKPEPVRNESRVTDL